MTSQAAAGHRAGSAVAIRPPAFTGRARELADLTLALASPPAVIMVEGEAGIGKTRLVRQFLAAERSCARPFARLLSQCVWRQ